MKEINPFPSIGYYGKEYFCDRENEIKLFEKNIENGVNMTLISARRLGKSALIHRIFEEFEEKKDYLCLYIDIYATQNLKDFTETLAMAVLKKIPEKRGIWQKFMGFLKAFHPVISYDRLTGQPQVSFEFSHPNECEHTLAGIFGFIEKQDRIIVIAFDEFQQVACYPEKNAEAILRTIIQALKNIRFIFCGSKKHLMIEIFNSAKRPFFSSTQMTKLNPIAEEKYQFFIREKFEERKRRISDEAIGFILEWTKDHTYYTQTVCNNLYASQLKSIDVLDVKRVCNDLLLMQQTTYIQYRNLLSPVQWKLLIAIAKEEKLYQPQSKDFLQRHQLGTPASIKRALDALMEKEMIYSDEDNHMIWYQVYDVFLSRWLQRTF